MKKHDRKVIGFYMRYELQSGEHTFHQCGCGRRGCRDKKCWECWLEILEEGKAENSLHGKDVAYSERKLVHADIQGEGK
jgi:hypothetical protein